MAKKIAKDKGIDLADVEGSGGNGRIIKSDVENFTPKQNLRNQQNKILLQRRG